LARKILLADDSVTAQNMGRRILTDAGYEVATVNNGSAALKKIAEQKPDLIVLDVYMPGYGGLEVCQRLKENRDTARIPILLTVGKLEPFKPDEARRVRADGFIIKPFEASELLTALTKLEDKIVPQAENYKPGRFAKAIAAVDHITDRGEGFGDSETGWKDRLKIPSGKRSEEPEPEATPAAASKVSGIERAAGFKPAEATKNFERPMPAGVPQDITPEEIAAIAAAAAAFAGGNPAAVPETSPAEGKSAPAEISEASKGESSSAEAAKIEAVPAGEVAEVPAATFASAPETSESPAAAVSTEVAVPAPEVVAAPAATATEEKPQEIPAAVAQETSETKPSEISAPIPDNPMADPDVLAAIASLVPALPTNGESHTAEVGSAYTEVEKQAPAFSVASAIAQLAGVGVSTGPRWIAEEAPLESGEASLILEREMEKALAAMALMEAGTATAALPEAAASATQVSQSEFATSATPVVSSVSAETTAATVSENLPDSRTEVPSSVAEAVAETAQSPTPAEAVNAVSEVHTEVGADAPAIEPAATPEAKAEVALAAAAGAGSGTVESSAANEPAQQIATPPPTAETPVPPSAQGEAIPDAQLDAASAAAWENWQHIRESVVGADLTSKVAEAATATLKEAEESQAAEAAETEGAAEAAPAAGSDPSAIASIVDSVLAELKPKLVEEIAKKMGNEKEKKKKKK
jgi:CheY-like chemotaxis protein